MNDPDQEKQDQGKAIPCAGEMPTPEEWLKYVVEKLKEDGRDDLLMAFRKVIYNSGLQIVKKELLKKCEMTPLIIDFW